MCTYLSACNSGYDGPCHVIIDTVKQSVCARVDVLPEYNFVVHNRTYKRFSVSKLTLMNRYKKVVGISYLYESSVEILSHDKTPNSTITQYHRLFWPEEDVVTQWLLTDHMQFAATQVINLESEFMDGSGYVYRINLYDTRLSLDILGDDLKHVYMTESTISNIPKELLKASIDLRYAIHKGS